MVLIDDSNLHYGFAKAGWSLDFRKFHDWLSNEFPSVECYFFGGLMSKKAYFDKHPDNAIGQFYEAVYNRKKFLAKIKSYGFHVRTKPVASVYDDTSGTYKQKCNFDVEITIMAIDRLPQYKDLVLCSGDGDFEKLVRYIKGKHKKVTVICHKDRLSRNLASRANRTISYREIRKGVEKT